jgi:hypothetical protein
MPSFRLLSLPCRTAAAAVTAFLTAASLLFTPHFQAYAADATTTAAAPKRLLIVTVTKGFRHGDSIPIAEQVIKALGEKDKSFVVDYVRTDDEMARKMTGHALKKYDGIAFVNTTGELPLPDQDAFLQWIRDGHAFVGMHAATDTFHKWPAYLEMIGAHFKTHGPQAWVVARNQDASHPATRWWGPSRLIYDEIYQFDTYDPATFHHLLDLDRHPNTGTPGEYPIAWCKNYGAGRVFYTSLGHRPDVWRNPLYQQHILGGIRWALGLASGDATPQPRPTAVATAPAATESNTTIHVR